jgi:hypothetical protein
MEMATTKMISGTAGFNHRLKSLFAARETGISLALLIICTLLTLTTSNFLTVQNLLSSGSSSSLRLDSISGPISAATVYFHIYTQPNVVNPQHHES